MKRKRLILWTAAAACCILAASGCSGRRSEQYRLEGDTYFGIGKYDEAVHSYEKAETANPINAKAQIGLGRCHEARGQFEEALARFARAIELDPLAEDAYKRSVDILLEEERNGEAASLAKQFAQANAERGGLLHAYILHDSGQVDEAVALLTGLRDRFPASPDIRVSLAGAFLNADEAEKAETELKTVLDELDPGSTTARIVLMESYRLQGKADMMVTEFEEFLKANPDSVELKQGLARCLLYAGRGAEAEVIAQDLLEQNPASGWADYILGSCALLRGDFDAAIGRLERAIALLPEKKEVARQLALARSSQREGTAPVRPSQGSAAEDGVAVPGEGDWSALWQQASLWRLVDNREALLLSEEPNLRETLVLSAIFQRNLGIARELAADLPEASPYHAYLDALESQSLEEIVSTFKSWEEEDQARQLLRENALGFALSMAGAREKALQVFSSCYKKWPENAVSLYNMASVFRDAKQPQFAARTLQQLISRYSSNLDAQRLLYQTLRDGNLKREARGVAETTYFQFPLERAAILNYGDALLDGQEPKLALILLNRAVEALPEDAKVRIALARVHLHLGQTEEAIQAIEAATDKSAPEFVLVNALCAAMQEDWDGVIARGAVLPPEQAGAGVLFLTAAAQAQLDQLPRAKEMLSNAASSFSLLTNASSSVLASALGLSSAPGLPSAAADESGQALASALAAAPKALAGFLLGAAYESLRQHDAALAAFASAEALVPGYARLGEIMMVNATFSALTEDRAALGREVAARYPNAPEVWLGLATLLRREGDAQGEQDVIKKALEIGSSVPRVLLRYGQSLESQGLISEAIAAYRDLLALQPDDIAGNNNLAYLLVISGGDSQEALELAAKAKEGLPQSASVLHTLGLAQLEAGELEQSAVNLQLALQFRPGDPTLLLDYGRLLIAQGEPETGKSNVAAGLRYADQLGLSFPRRGEAAAILEEETGEASASVNKQ